MNIIRLGTDNSITLHQYPEDHRYAVVHPFLCSLIGDGCDTLESVRPIRLYSRYGGPVDMKDPHLENGMALMLVDEEGRITGKPYNRIASWFYGADIHESIIAGNVVFCGLCIDDASGEIDFCGLEHETKERILEHLRHIAAQLEGGAQE